MDINKLNVAIVHDYMTQWGGAEGFVRLLHDIFPKAPIYTTVLDRGILPDEMKSVDIRTSFLQGAPLLPRALKAYVPLLPLAIERLDLRSYDLVLSSTSAFAHGVSVSGKHIAYVHNTMRFAWDYQKYFANYKMPATGKMLARLGAPFLKKWDMRAAKRPDILLANSKVVAERIATRWGRQAQVMYCPVDVSGYRIGTGERHHLAVVSRLVPYKRIDLAIKAVNVTGDRLLVVGDGPDRLRLQAMAKDNVSFLGRVSENEKRTVLESASAVLIPGEEDFGIVPIEANACGTPVVALAAGGVLETQIDGVTGALYSGLGFEDIVEAVKRARKLRFSPEKMAQNADRFSRAAFATNLRRVITDMFQGDAETST